MKPVEFRVNADTCIRCGMCVEDCVAGIIAMAEMPEIDPKDRGNCIHCGHCQAICPTGSITLDGHTPESLAEVENSFSESDIKNLVQSRRSVRHFATDPVNKKLLERIINMASWAPTASNKREISFIVINGRDKVERLMLAAADIMRKRNFLPGVAERIFAGQDVIFRGAPCVLITHAPEKHLAMADCATVLATLELALPSYGLASCWAGYLTHVCELELPAGIFIPAGHKMYGGLMIGRPTVSYQRVPFRAEPEIEWI